MIRQVGSEIYKDSIVRKQLLSQLNISALTSLDYREGHNACERSQKITMDVKVLVHLNARNYYIHPELGGIYQGLLTGGSLDGLFWNP